MCKVHSYDSCFQAKWAMLELLFLVMAAEDALAFTKECFVDKYHSKYAAMYLSTKGAGGASNAAMERFNTLYYAVPGELPVAQSAIMAIDKLIHKVGIPTYAADSIVQKLSPDLYKDYKIAEMTYLGDDILGKDGQLLLMGKAADKILIDKDLTPYHDTGMDEDDVEDDDEVEENDQDEDDFVEQDDSPNKYTPIVSVMKFVKAWNQVYRDAKVSDNFPVLVEMDLLTEQIPILSNVPDIHEMDIDDMWTKMEAFLALKELSPKSWQHSVQVAYCTLQYQHS